MIVDIASCLKLTYEPQVDDKFFGSFNSFVKYVNQRTEEYNHISKESFNYTLKNIKNQILYINIGYGKSFLSEIKQSDETYYKKSLKINDLRTEASMVENFVHPYAPRDYLQKEAIKKFLDSKKNGYIVAPCGSGKTYMALKITEALKQKTLIIVDEIMLLDQWADDIIYLCGFPPERMGELHGKKKDYIDKDILIATKQTINNDPEILKYVSENYSFAIIDECHTSATQVFTELLMKLKPKYRLGLTATPERQDGFDFLLELNIGPKIAHLDQRALIEAGSILESDVHPIFVMQRDARLGIKAWDKKLKSSSRVMVKWRALVDELFSQESLHKAVARNIYKKYKEGYTAACILAEKKWIEFYYNELLALGVVTEEIEIIKGETEKDYRKEVLARAKSGEIKIILTSKLLDKAISINRLDCIHLIFPSKATGNIEQRVGRIARTHPDKKDPIVFDYIFDNYVFFKQLYNIFTFCRMKAYEKTSDIKKLQKLINILKPYFESRDIKEREEHRKKIIDNYSKKTEYKEHIILVD